MCGVRVTDTPLTPRACADFTGFTSQWIRDAINHGVDVEGVLVTLEAEVLLLNGRTNYRIYEQDFVTFLKAIGWKHLPRRTAALSPPLRAVPARSVKGARG
jgi:hypothetical protein